MIPVNAHSIQRAKNISDKASLSISVRIELKTSNTTRNCIQFLCAKHAAKPPLAGLHPQVVFPTKNDMGTFFNSDPPDKLTGLQLTLVVKAEVTIPMISPRCPVLLHVYARQ